MSKKLFICPEESCFYSSCLTMFFTQNIQTPDKAVIEFGTGDGKPMIDALLQSSFQGSVHGYEMNSHACQRAESLIKTYHLDGQYVIHDANFFHDDNLPQAEILVTNPPYLPAPKPEGLLLPELYGGPDGTTVSKRLLSMDFQKMLLLMSSISNPAAVLQRAAEQGYFVACFWVTPMPFGRYSSQAVVRHRIAELRQQRQAFCSEQIYLVAGVVFQRNAPANGDASAVLKQIMRAL